MTTSGIHSWITERTQFSLLTFDRWDALKSPEDRVRYRARIELDRPVSLHIL